MVPRTVLAVVSAAAIWAVQGVRFDIEEDPLPREKDPLPAGDECSMKQVQSLICGTPEVYQCGHTKKCPTKWSCYNQPKMCTRNKKCSVMDKCPVTLYAEVAGQGTIDDIDDTYVKAHIVSVRVTQGVKMVRDLINTNSELVMPLMNQVLAVAEGELNKQVKLEIDKVKLTLLSDIKEQNIGRFLGFLNNVNANEAIERVLTKTMGNMKGNITKREEIQVPGEYKNWRMRLCHRKLRVREQDGETYLIDDWRNAVIARKYDEAKRCDTVYSAQCRKGIVIKTKQCPFKEPKSTSYCLFGAFCWRMWYTIKGSESKVISMPQPDRTEKMLIGKHVWVDHVSAKSATRTGLTAKSLTGEDAFGAGNLNSELQLKVPDFQKTLVEDMCTKAGDKAYFGFSKSFRRFRCRSLLNSVSHFARWTGNVPVPDMKPIRIRVSLRDDLMAAAVPHWPSVESMASLKVMEALKKKEEEEGGFPMGATVSKFTVRVGGEANILKLLHGTAASVSAQIEMGGMLPGELPGDIGGMLR